MKRKLFLSPLFITDKHELELPMNPEQATLLVQYSTTVENSIALQKDTPALHVTLPFLTHDQLTIFCDYLSLWEEEKYNQCNNIFETISVDADDFILASHYLGLPEEITSSLKTILQSRSGPGMEKPPPMGNIRDQMLAFTKDSFFMLNQQERNTQHNERPDSPPPPPPVNTKAYEQGYYEYNEDAAFD